MNTETNIVGPREQYDEAHRIHHVEKDLRVALGLYTDILSAYPDAREAGYCRAQVWNIVKVVVPQEELVGAHVAAARASMDRKDAAAETPPALSS